MTGLNCSTYHAWEDSRLVERKVRSSAEAEAAEARSSPIRKGKSVRCRNVVINLSPFVSSGIVDFAESLAPRRSKSDADQLLLSLKTDAAQDSGARDYRADASRMSIRL